MVQVKTEISGSYLTVNLSCRKKVSVEVKNKNDDEDMRRYLKAKVKVPQKPKAVETNEDDVVNEDVPSESSKPKASTDSTTHPVTAGASSPKPAKTVSISNMPPGFVCGELGD